MDKGQRVYSLKQQINRLEMGKQNPTNLLLPIATLYLSNSYPRLMMYGYSMFDVVYDVKLLPQRVMGRNPLQPDTQAAEILRRWHRLVRSNRPLGDQFILEKWHEEWHEEPDGSEWSEDIVDWRTGSNMKPSDIL